MVTLPHGKLQQLEFDIAVLRAKNERLEDDLSRCRQSLKALLDAASKVYNDIAAERDNAVTRLRAVESHLT